MGRPDSDHELDFAAVLGASIERHYASRGDFARKAGVGEASVSRWLNRQTSPDRRSVEQIAPYVLDPKGHPIPAAKLLGLAHPGLAPGGVRVVYVDRPIHPLAREVDELLGENSSIPKKLREGFVALLDQLLEPYRRHIRKRKAS